MSKVTTYLLSYGLTHALVDASCIILLLGGIDVKGDLFRYIILYNLLAFGLQLPLGWLNDQIQRPVSSAVSGCILVGLSLQFFYNPLVAILLAGIGNALFHVGGGTVSLSLSPGKASFPGLFVAPGGIGLFAGGMVLKFYGFHPEIIASLLVTMGLALLLLKSPEIIYKLQKPKTSNFFALILILLLITICIRSVVGLSVSFPWKSNLNLLICLTAAIALGKGLGGFLADYFGWIKIAVGGLAISALLLVGGSKLAIAGIAGLFFFNLTMPVTLVAISNLLPGKPGFSFGLSALAVLVGALPTFFKTKSFLSESPVILLLVVISTIILYFGLKLYNQHQIQLKS